MDAVANSDEGLNGGRPGTRRIRAGIVGTGYIADFHARAIRGVHGAELLCVADANQLSAESFAKTRGISAAYDSLQTMLRNHDIDCVHLLVPPDQHFPLAKSALEAGVHVLLEKPMCTSTAEADQLLQTAAQRQLYLGVNHNFLFSSAYRRLRDTVKSGILGPISHITIHYLAELPHIRFGPFDAWMLRRPGNVILETGPHLFSAILDLVGEPQDLSAVVDGEVMIPGGNHVFRRWHIRTTVGPADVNIDINFGPGFPERKMFVRGLFGSATIDLDADTCVVERYSPLDPDLDRYSRSRRLSKQIRSQALRTVSEYISGKLKLSNRGNPFQNSIMDSVAAFYSAIQTGQPLDTRIDGGRGRDVIKCCLRTIEAAGLPHIKTPTRSPPLQAPSTNPTVLVLGGAGFIGRELIRQLLSNGYSVRALLRGSAAILDDLRSDRLELVRGDIRSETDVRAAMAGIEFVYHLAHAPAKTWAEYRRNDVEPTRLLAEICLDLKIKRLVYTGTIASYYAGARSNIITETTPLDSNIRRRDYYSRAKAECENMLVEMHRTRQLPMVIFRPGIVIGPGGNPFHWGVGRFSQNICEVWGDGNNSLPFVLVTDVAAALVRGIQVPGIEGRSYNLIDLPLVSAKTYLDELQQRSGLKLFIDYRPIWKFYFSDLVKWAAKAIIGHPDKIRIPSYYDWETRTQKGLFNCDRARTELGWTPASDRSRILDEGIGGALRTWLAAIG
jgi:predicted dehydrogenase/nucleoside-diphosphate-sugar epimerase